MAALEELLSGSRSGVRTEETEAVMSGDRTFWETSEGWGGACGRGTGL